MKYIFVILTVLLTIVSTVSAVTPTPTPPREPYQLPYPGILPTHPLYFFKNIRDAIIEAMISDDSKKVQFYLLQADKKLQMAMLLSDQKKEEESNDILQESEESHAKAVSLVLEKKQKILRHITEQVMYSIEKHKEVFESRNWDAKTKNDFLDQVNQHLVDY